MTDIEKFMAALEQFPLSEREKISRAILKTREYGMGQSVADAITQTVIAAGRVAKKRTQDAANDHRRRVLVGARVPREFAERCRQDAQAQNMSLYAWVKLALEQMFYYKI